MTEVLGYQPTDNLPPRRYWRIACVGTLVLLLAWTIGVATNFVNGLVSREYFELAASNAGGVTLSLWDIVRQGLMAATASGAVASVMLVPIYFAITGCRLPISKLLPISAVAAGVACAFHLVTGLSFLVWGAADPSAFSFRFPLAQGSRSLLAYAYVSGAVHGVYAGGGGAVVVLTLGIAREWNHLKRKLETRL